MTNFLTVALQVAILFVLIGVGALARRVRLLDEKAVAGMVNLLILVVTPALIVDVFQRPFDPSTLRQFALAFPIAFAVHFALILIACLTARGDARRRPVLKLAMVFSNAGFMGIPLEQAILGADGVFYGIVYVATFNLFIWSWGILAMRERKGAGEGFPWKAVVNPGTVGLAVGFPLFALSLKLPAFLGEPVHHLANLNTPLAMVAIGFYLAGAKLGPVLRSGAAHLAAAIRLLLFPLLFVGVLWLLRGVLDRTMALSLVIGVSAPVAAMVPMFAAKFGRDVDAAVGLVSGTTLLSVLTMPLVIAIALEALP